jgi:hypothetical protein
MVRYQSVMDGGRGRSGRDVPTRTLVKQTIWLFVVPALVLCGLVAWLLKDLPWRNIGGDLANYWPIALLFGAPILLLFLLWPRMRDW